MKAKKEVKKIKKVFICSPLRGNVTKNIKLARKYSRDVALRGKLPITPHIYFTQFLDENDPVERELGMKLSQELLKLCDEMEVYGEPTGGMIREIRLWESL